MTALSANLRLRPTRIGFLVNPSDMASVREVMRACSCLWGGLYNPIIPVCASVPDAWLSPGFRPLSGTALAHGYINFFEPDLFVEADRGLSKALNIKDAELEIGCRRLSVLSEMLTASQDRKDVPAVGLSIFGLYKELYEREFKFVARHDNRIAIFEPASSSDEPFLEATCGAFPKDGAFAPLAQAYRDAFAPTVLKGNAKNWAKALQEGFRFPLYFTRHGLERDPERGLAGPILFVADPASPLDLIDLWNIRLFRRDVIPINLRWFTALTPFIRKFICQNHRPLPGNPHGVMIQTTVEFGRSIGEVRATALAEAARLRDLPSGSWSFKLWYDSIWTSTREDWMVRPQRARVTANSQDLELTVTEDGRERSARFGNLSPDFAPRYNNGAAGWVNVLKFQNFGSGSTLALSLPNDFDPGRTRHLRIGGAIIPSREGLILPQIYKGHGEYLRLMTGREAMIEWLKQHGVKAEISGSGRTAEQIMGNLNGFWGAKLLAHKETLQLLDRMAKSAKKYGDGTVEEYPDRTAAATEWTALISRRTQDMWSSSISLDQYVDAKILKLGLSIKCNHCEFANWYAVSDLKEAIVCDRCRREYPFPQGSINFNSAPWKFRVVGPFSVPDFADGAYATILTLRVFAETLPSNRSSLTYAPGLTLIRGEEKPLEVDFSLWYRRESWGGDEEETVTVFGEAKSFATKCFRAEDVERMRRIAVLFPGAFVVFAVLKDVLHDDERNAIAELAQWGREALDDGRPRAPVIVLTGAELFCNWRISKTWEELDGKRKQFSDGHMRFDNLWTFADATQQVYLGLPSRSEDLRRKIESAKSDAKRKASKKKSRPATG